MFSSSFNLYTSPHFCSILSYIIYLLTYYFKIYIMGILSKYQRAHIIKLIIYWLFCSIMLTCSRINATKSNIANFVFGDSLVDVGNNNYIATLSKANYVPNGIDFGMPTGRFTNGRTIIDIIGKFYFLHLFCSFFTLVFF